MNPSHYRDLWASLLEKKAREEAFQQLARQVAFSFIDHCYYGDHYEPEYVDLLCEMATASSNASLNATGSSALFGVVIEELCDDYEDFQFETYLRVMTQVISFCRKMPEARWMDERLHRFGCHTSEDVDRYARKVREGSCPWQDAGSIRHIFLLSRITIGADVAIVSVMVQRLLRRFPEATIHVLGSTKLQEIFSSNDRVQISEIHYARRGGLLERFEAWESILEILDEGRRADPDACLVIDPDSRLTQLGILPLSHEVHTLYFDSHKVSQRAASMAELTNEWIDDVFGRDAFCYPKVWPPPETSAFAADLASRLRDKGCERLVAVNLGVGGNARKRLGSDFERKLILRLLQSPGTSVLLDMGLGSDEWEAAQALLKAAREEGKTGLQILFGTPPMETPGPGLIGIQCSIGQMAALISRADEYIGYDSACQHMAAGLEIPTLTVFAGTNNPRFIRRWSACGPKRPRIVHVNTLMHGVQTDIDGVVDRVMQERVPGISVER